MTTWKSIVTITWKFDSDDSEEECLEKTRKQLETILDVKPHGEEFEGFGIQVDIAQMKDRKKLIHLGSFHVDEVFPFVTSEDIKKEYVVNGKKYLVRMNSDRYQVFKDNNRCVACGLTGTKMVLDMNPGDNSPHFNLYAEEDGRLILMTKDHILAKSKGGPDSIENYVTCCAICNNLKGNYDLNYDEVRMLREMFNNADKLPKKELRELINVTRSTMSKRNSALANK